MQPLDDVIARIVDVAHPDRIILFGSAARDSARPDSDIDLLVIKRGVPSRRRLAQAIYRALVGIPVPVDVIVVTPEDIDRPSSARSYIKVRLDDVLEALETKYPAKLKGLLPRIYAGSNLDADSVRGLINLFSKDIFEADHGSEDLIGRVYEYFIGEFASSEGRRGGEYFTPVSIVTTLVATLEPEKGVVFDP